MITDFDHDNFEQMAENVENRGRLLHRVRVEVGHTNLIKIFENNACTSRRMKRINIQ